MRLRKSSTASSFEISPCSVQRNVYCLHDYARLWEYYYLYYFAYYVVSKGKDSTTIIHNIYYITDFCRQSRTGYKLLYREKCNTYLYVQQYDKTKVCRFLLISQYSAYLKNILLEETVYGPKLSTHTTGHRLYFSYGLCSYSVQTILISNNRPNIHFNFSCVKINNTQSY